MKITLSKRQWEFIGKKAGWVRKADKEMNQKMNSFFSPSIKLVRMRMNGKPLSGDWYVDLVKDRPLAKQIIEEANIKNRFGTRISDADLDAFTSKASEMGYSVETIGE